MELRWIGPVERFAGRPSAPYILGAIGFASSSFLPIPPDILLVPMAVMLPDRIWRLTWICTVTTALGALAGYAIGAEFWDLIGQRMVELYGWTEQFQAFQRVFAEWGLWIIVLKAFTPIPFKIAAIAAGLARMDLLTFTLASFASRALHFVLMALLLIWLGPRAQEAIRKYETRTAVVGGVAVAVTVIYVSLH
ncbi:MAG TPA: VTT domain-containing protein [Alphaproteobacteria bacterium]|nr:VTT domain-containing protein [Alphaproteobacteria bacterium]